MNAMNAMTCRYIELRDIARHPDGARVSVRYKLLADRHRTKTAVITIDRKWFTMQASKREGEISERQRQR